MIMTRKDAIAATKAAKRVYASVPLTDHDRFLMQVTKRGALDVIEKMIGVYPEAFDDGVKIYVYDDGDVVLG